jgi:hypothetical protein
VVLETPIEKVRLNEKDLYRFKVFSWGSLDFPEMEMTWFHFMNNYNGYIKVK